MKRSLLVPRVNILPEEYPELDIFRLAINSSMWFGESFTFSADKIEFYSVLTKVEGSLISKSLLAVSQIEVKVKRMWAELFSIFPKPEIDAIGISFAESEVRHQRAYRRLLEELGLEEMFLEIENIPCLNNRVEYLSKYLRSDKEDMNKVIIFLTLFTLCIENSSLFGQFGIIKVISAKTNSLKDTDNVIMDTTKEENIHALFGVRLIKILQEENPEVFPSDYEKLVVEACKKSCEAEFDIIDWIFESGETEYLKKDNVKEYVKFRLNYSLSLLNIPEIYKIDEDLIECFEDFEVEQASTVHVDFFHKKNPNYDKYSRAATNDDLF